MADFMQEHESAHDHELVMEDDLLQDGESAPTPDRVHSQSRERGYQEMPEQRWQVRAGDVLAGRYCVERLHARGVSGVTVDAQHLQLGQRVALKCSLADARFPDNSARFLRGARLAAQFRNEHVARVIDLGTLDSGTAYSVTEHLSGTDLRGVLRVREWLPVAEATDYILQACEGLAEAHMLGLVHRNLKLSNLFLAREYDGRTTIKVLDFCLAEGSVAAATAALSLSGPGLVHSLAYLAPEQIRAPNSVDFRADIWALGALLHELLTGAPVYAASSALGLLAAIAADAPTPASHVRSNVPVELEAIILRCLEKDRECRWPDLGTFARQLRPFASAQGRESVERVILMLERRVRGARSTPPALPGTTRAITRVPSAAGALGPALPRRAIELGVAVLGVVGCSIGIGAFVAIHNLRAVLALRPVEHPVIASLSPALTAPQPIAASALSVAVPAPVVAPASAPPAVASPTVGTFAPQLSDAMRRTPRVEAKPTPPLPSDERTEQAAVEPKAPPTPAAQHALFDSIN
jgi:serine/threonine-protein kinase